MFDFTDALKLAGRLRTEGGFTVALDMSQPASGYLVGGVTDERVVRGAHGSPSDENMALEIMTFALLNPILDRDGYYLGAWRDSHTGNVHLDVSELYRDLGSATHVGQRRGELALWHIDTRTEIRL